MAPDIQRKSCQQRESKRAPETVGEGAEKEEKLTAVTRVRLGEPEEDRSGRISPVTIEEEEDADATAVDLGSIPSWRTERTTC
jgi:hypothetical protein